MKIRKNVFFKKKPSTSIGRLLERLECLIKCEFKKMRCFMSKISEFADRVSAYLDRQETAITGLTEDVQFLKAKIEEIQNSPGTLSPEDQASLDAAEARVASATEKLEALDTLTPPVPPAE